MIIRIADYIRESFVDGPGIRFTVFVQGCPHGCPGCHNPQTHDFDGGREISVDEIIRLMRKDPLLSGVTLSGGEPFCQPEPLIELAEETHRLGLNVFAYSGWTYEELTADPDKAALLAVCDWLADGPFLLSERDLELQFRGSRNQRLIDLRATRETGELVVRERI